MKPEKVLKFTNASKCIALLGLLIGAGFFVKDITLKYISKDSSYKTFTKQVEKLKPPTFTLCFNPYMKRSILEKYNLTYTQVQSLKMKDLSIPYPTFYKQANYKLGLDFKISLGDLKGTKFEIDDINFMNDIIKIEELYTIWNGICVKVSQNISIPNYEENTITVKFNDSFKIKDLPEVQIFVTSDQNAYGILDAHWADGSVFSHHIQPQLMKSYSFYLSPVWYKSLKETSHCNDEYEFNLQCVSKKY